MMERKEDHLKITFNYQIRASEKGYSFDITVAIMHRKNRRRLTLSPPITPPFCFAYLDGCSTAFYEYSQWVKKVFARLVSS